MTANRLGRKCQPYALLALQDNEIYLDQPARKMVSAVKLYSESLVGASTADHVVVVRQNTGPVCSM